jgi:hypothetical protein
VRQGIAILIVAFVVGLVIAGFALWGLYRELNQPPENDEAKREVQKYYDGRFPGLVKVEKCSFVEDAEGSDFDNYSCEVSIRCRKQLEFSVPRSTVTLSDSDQDASPNFVPRQKPC